MEKSLKPMDEYRVDRLLKELFGVYPIRDVFLFVTKKVFRFYDRYRRDKS